MQLNKILLLQGLLTVMVFSETLDSSSTILSKVRLMLQTIRIPFSYLRDSIRKILILVGKILLLPLIIFLSKIPLLSSTTIIDGNNNGSVVSFDDSETNTAVLQGFTLQNGDGNMQIQMRMVLLHLWWRHLLQGSSPS